MACSLDAVGMRGMVPGVSPGDPTAFIVVAATLISAGLASAYAVKKGPVK